MIHKKIEIEQPKNDAWNAICNTLWLDNIIRMKLRYFPYQDIYAETFRYMRFEMKNENKMEQ